MLSATEKPAEKRYDPFHETTVQFDLKYRGPLPSSTPTNQRSAEKHAIREYLRPQLAAIWNRDPRLAPIDTNNLQSAIFHNGYFDVPRPLTGPGSFFFYHQVLNLRFVPLVNYVREASCAVTIKLFQRSGHGHIIVGAGDLDNRLKTLFDALRMPHTPQELPGNVQPFAGPFFCLLDDDAIITRLSIETCPWWVPPAAGEAPDNIELDIHVDITTIYPMAGNVDWLF